MRQLLIAVATTAVGVVLGFQGAVAYACEERGPNLREEWDLEIVDVQIEGEPRIELLVEVGGTATLHRGGKKRNEVVLSNPGMIFEKVSE